MLIGAIGLVVLGPEKLPIVAKTAGEWIGKAQRMVQQVKNDIEREAELSELKQIQEEARNAVNDLNKTVQGELDSVKSDVNALESDVNAAAKDMTDSFDAAKDAGTTPVGDTPDPVNDFFGWYGSELDDKDEKDSGVQTTFEKRYKSGPSIDELAEQIERLKAELGDRSPRLEGNNRRYAARARTNRPRIYR